MFKTKERRDTCIFTKFSWTGGIYVTASMAGSRNGSLVIGAWTAMMRLGREG